eukprot:COSAG05_NODE_752_length_7532_cov_44.503565_1_plen_53_part_00
MVAVVVMDHRYHFRTVHQWLAGTPPGFPLKLDHRIKAQYGSASQVGHAPTVP